MTLTKEQKNRIGELKKQYDILKKGKKAFLDAIFELELPDAVYNSNAIEDVPLSLKQTERILLGKPHNKISLIEENVAKNLAKVFKYIKEQASKRDLNKDFILFLHKILMANVNEDIAGRFRKGEELINLGTHVSPLPGLINGLLDDALLEYKSNTSDYFLEKIAKFHVFFEHTHPFVDGNGRIGRALLNFQLMKLGFPPVIIQVKDKPTYFTVLRAYSSDGKVEPMVKMLYLALMESLEKRIAYLSREAIDSWPLPSEN